jgi:phosphatidylglycerophosphatase A
LIILADSRQPDLRFVMSHPAHFIAFSGGVGLAPQAPGSFGTLAAFPIFYLLAPKLGDVALLALIAAAWLAGVWACDRTGRDLGVVDHGGMVWDETIAFLLVLVMIPKTLIWQAFGFLLFRIFDIAKPQPIRYFDATVKNGFGVMFDDALAAAYTLLAVALWQVMRG